MRVLLIGNGWLVRPLEALGHEVIDAYGRFPAQCLPGVPFDVRALWSQLPAAPDVLIVADMLGPQALPWGLEHVPVPRVYWAIDVHLNHFWQRPYARGFDLVCATQRDWVPRLADAAPAHWLPWGVDDVVFRDVGAPRRHDVAFVGCLDPLRRPKRQAVVDRLRRRFRVVTAGTSPGERVGWDAIAALYQQARVVVNESILGEVNFRTFEATGCGALLVTERIGNGLDALLTPGVHCDVFGPDDLEARVAGWLGDEAARARVAAAGAAHVHARHTMRARMAELMALVTAGIPRRDVAAEAPAGWAVAAVLAAQRGLLHPGVTLPHAATLLQQRLRARPDDMDAALALVDVLVWCDQHDAARKALALARGAAPTDPRPVAVAATLAARDGADRSVAACVRVLATMAAPADRVRVAAAAAYDASEADRERAAAQALLAAGRPLVPGFVAVTGPALPHAAFDHLQRAVDLGSADAAGEAAALLDLAGLPELGLPFAERLAAARPTDPAARALRATLLHRSHRVDEAAHQRRLADALAGRGLRDGTPAERAAAWHEAGVALLDAGAAAAAVALLDEAVAVDPSLVAAWADGGVACIALEDWHGAHARLVRAAALAGAGEPALAELLELVRPRVAAAALAASAPSAS